MTTSHSGSPWSQAQAEAERATSHQRRPQKCHSRHLCGGGGLEGGGLEGGGGGGGGLQVRGGADTETASLPLPLGRGENRPPLPPGWAGPGGPGGSGRRLRVVYVAAHFSRSRFMNGFLQVSPPPLSLLPFLGTRVGHSLRVILPSFRVMSSGYPQGSIPSPPSHFQWVTSTQTKTLTGGEDVNRQGSISFILLLHTLLDGQESRLAEGVGCTHCSLAEGVWCTWYALRTAPWPRGSAARAAS